MKKIYTIAALLASASVINAQNLNKAAAQQHTVASKNASVTTNNNPAPAAQSAAVIWTDDFSTPANWTMSVEAGAANDNWIIGTAGPSGSFAIPAINSTTKANGFALFDSDVLCSGNQVANLTTTNSINLSANPAVLLQFQQSYRRFYDSTFVFVSNDNINWTKFVVNKTVAVNASTANPDNVSINITSAAGGQATVWIRFQFWSPSSLGSSAGCGYAWMVDDVAIVDAPANDVRLGQVYFGEYSKIPAGQQMPISFSGYVSNEGAAVQTDVKLIVNVNSGAFVDSSASVTLPTSAQDSLYIVNTFTPGNVGAYSIAFTADQSESDTNTTDNSRTVTIAVSDSTFSRDNNFYDGGGLWLGDGASYEMGNVFEIFANTQAKSINFVLQGNTTAGIDVRVKLYEVDATTGDFVEIATSDPHTVTAADIPAATGANPKSVTLPFIGGPVALNAGTMYIAVVVNENATTNNNVVLADGTDIIQPIGSSLAFDPTEPVATQWGYLSGTPLVRLILVAGVGVEETANNNNVSVYPNPSNGFVTINSDITEKSTISVINTVGQVVYAEASASVANKNLDLSGLAKGVYFVQIVSEKASVTKKIILE